MKLETLTQVNIERAARRPVIVVTDTANGEQRLVKALGWLKKSTATLPAKISTVLAANAHRRGEDAEALQRMGLGAPKNWRERLDARLVSLALSKTSGKADS